MHRGTVSFAVGAVSGLRGDADARQVGAKSV